MHTTLLATDIVGFADRYRDISAQLYARQTMYELLIGAFDITGLPWWDSYREDRGDGALIVAPPAIDPGRFLDPLTHHLDALLRSHARRTSDSARLHLRMAVHYGYVCYDAHGVTGDALTRLFRILDAPAFRMAMAAAETHIGVIVSDQLYTRAIQRGGPINPAAYAHMRLSCKETCTSAWVRFPSGSR